MLHKLYLQQIIFKSYNLHYLLINTEIFSVNVNFKCKHSNRFLNSSLSFLNTLIISSYQSLNDTKISTNESSLTIICIH